MQVRYIGTHPGAAPGQPAWQPGEVRELDAATGARLCASALWQEEPEEKPQSAARRREAADARGEQQQAATTEEVR